MLLRDQIVIQIGEEVDGMVMIRSGDNRQGVCPVKFLQEVWHHSEVACQATYTCNCSINNSQITSSAAAQINVPPPLNTLNKLYYPNPTTRLTIQNNNNTINNNNNNNKNKNFNNHSGNILQYYYNNFNSNFNKNNSNNKQTNVYNNNVLQRRRNELAFLNGKAPFSSTKRPLSIRLSTPKHVVKFLSKPFRSDSQKRPLLMQGSNNHDNMFMPSDFHSIVPSSNNDDLKNASSSSSIYTISENVEKFNLYRKNLYISSNCRPLFVRK